MLFFFFLFPAASSFELKQQKKTESCFKYKVERAETEQILVKTAFVLLSKLCILMIAIMCSECLFTFSFISLYLFLMWKAKQMAGPS